MTAPKILVYQDPEQGDIAYKTAAMRIGHVIVSHDGMRFDYTMDTASTIPERFVPLHPAPTLEEMRAAVGKAFEELPDPDATDPVHVRWAGSLLLDLDDRKACYKAGDFFAAAERLEAEAEARAINERREHEQVTAIARALVTDLGTGADYSRLSSDAQAAFRRRAAAALSALRAWESAQ